MQSAVLRSHVVCLSVRLSVCLFVTLVDQDHIGWKSWANLGETRGGVEKSGVLGHKSGNISETREDRGKVTMGSL